MAETRAAISRSVRSESARRAISARDRCELLDEPGVGDRDGGLVGQRGQQAGVGVVEGVDPVRVGVDDAEDLVAVDQRRGQHRVDRRLADEGVAVGRVLEALVLEVVAGPRRGPGPDRQARDADVRVDLDAVEELEVGLGPRLDLGVEPGLRHALPVDEVDGHAAGLEEAGRRIDDRLEDLALVAHRADAAGDLAQRPLGVGGLGELGARPAELVDQPRVRDGDRRLARPARRRGRRRSA